MRTPAPQATLLTHPKTRHIATFGTIVPPRPESDGVVRLRETSVMETSSARMGEVGGTGASRPLKIIEYKPQRKRRVSNAASMPRLAGGLRRDTHHQTFARTFYRASILKIGLRRAPKIWALRTDETPSETAKLPAAGGRVAVAPRRSLLTCITHKGSQKSADATRPRRQSAKPVTLLASSAAGTSCSPFSAP